MILRVLPLLARPSRQGLGTLLLPGFAFATVTLLLAIVIGGARTLMSYDDELGLTYVALTVIALALLATPLISLGLAAARLVTRRRDDRLAVLRLLGATGRDTAFLAVIESAGVAFAGAATGLGASYALAPLVGLIPFRGAPIGTAAAALPPLIAAALVAAVTLIAVVSAVLGLRRVVVSPLGVARRELPARPSRIAALVAVLLVAGAALLMNLIGSISEAVGVVAVVLILGGGFALTLLALDLIGGWLLGVLGRARLHRAERPEDLIAARLVLENPRVAWRQVSGVAMASFTAVFAGAGVALLGAAGDQDPASAHLIQDVRTGIIITVLGSFIMVACSVGVHQAAQILDRRDVTRSLSVMGTPLETQDRARRQAATLPLLLAAAGSAVLAGVLLFPLVGISLIVAPLSLLTIAGSIAGGCLVVLASLRATRPLMRASALPG